MIFKSQKGIFTTFFKSANSLSLPLSVSDTLKPQHTETYVPNPKPGILHLFFCRFCKICKNPFLRCLEHPYMLLPK